MAAVVARDAWIAERQFYDWHLSRSAFSRVQHSAVFSETTFACTWPGVADSAMFMVSAALASSDDMQDYCAFHNTLLHRKPQHSIANPSAVPHADV